MKECCKCHKILPLESFNNSKKYKDGKQQYCVGCARIYYKAHRDRGLLDIPNSVCKESNKKVLRLFIIHYLETHPCIDCGEKDVVVLDFDHVKGQKSFSISQAIADNIPLTELMLEIEKCDVRCSNCHRRKTAIERNYFKLHQLTEQQRQFLFYWMNGGKPNKENLEELLKTHNAEEIANLYQASTSTIQGQCKHSLSTYFLSFREKILSCFLPNFESLF